MKKATIVEVIIILYAILFLYTGISKLMEYKVFREQIAESPILAPVAPLIAHGLPLFEFFLVLLLVMPRWRLKGLYASTGLMTIFTIYIITIMVFNDQLPCSCGGIMASLSWRQHLVFNSVFILLGITGAILQRKIRHDINQSLNAIRNTIY